MSLELASLVELSTLEQLLGAQGVEGLLAGLEEAIARLPPASRWRGEDGLELSPRTLKIVRGAVALDAAFLRAHPEALFQCLYNRLRWFDAPDAAAHYAPGAEGPWSRPEAHLFTLAERWRQQHEARGGAPWLESLLPMRGELESHEQVLRHEGAVLCAAYDRAGTRLATGSWSDGRNVQVWDVATGQRTLVMEGHDTEVFDVAWSPDGKRLASGSRSHDARIWDAETGALLHAMGGQEGRVMGVAFSPDGRVLATANLGWKVRLFDTASGRELRTLEGHEQSALCVAFHPSGRWVASGASDDTARVWDVASGEEVARIEAETAVRSLAFSADGRWLALTANEGIALVETRGWTVDRTLQEGSFYSRVEWIDGTRLGVVAHDRVEVLDLDHDEVLRSRPFGHEGGERTAAFHPAGKHYALTSSEAAVRVCELDAAPAPTLRSSEEQTHAVWGQTGGEVGVARRNLTSLFVEASGRPREHEWHPADVYAQPWVPSPDGRLLAFPCTVLEGMSSLCAIRLLDVKTLQVVRELKVRRVGASDSGEYMGDQPIAFSPDGTLVAGVVERGAVRLWRVADGALLHTLRGPKDDVSVVEFTSDGASVVFVSARDGRLWVYAVANGSRVLETSINTREVLSYALAAQTPLLALGRTSGALELIDLSTGFQQLIQVSKSGVLGVALSADGALVAASGGDDVVRVFESRTGTLRCELPHPIPVHFLAVAGDMVVTQDAGNTARFFDLATGAPRAELQARLEPQEVLEQPLWESLGESYALHRRQEPTPLVRFHDPMDSTVLLRDGRVLGLGSAERNFVYVLKLRGQV